MTDFGFLDQAGKDLAVSFVEHGPHPSYKAFESLAGPGQLSRGIRSMWAFMDDAITGKGGFANGDFLIPFTKESTSGGGMTLKLYERRASADYDQFAASVCRMAWDIIIQREDSIVRGCNDKRAFEFWLNADRQRNGILDVMEFSHIQSRLYLTGWLVIDAPEQLAQTAADESVLGQRPYMYGVRTQNVPHWHVDDDGEIDAIIILEPTPATTGHRDCPFRVWSRGGWATFTREDKSIVLVDSGVNGIGVVPVIPIHDFKPVDDWFIDATDMFGVARLAQTVYNQDSEARELERKAAMFLAMGVKDAKNFDTKAVTIGVDSLLIFDGEAGPPVWVSPEMQAHKTLTESREQKKAAAYEVANMRAMVGAIETTSGFHALVEFSKSERAIAKRAKALETAERKATEIYLRYLGLSTEQVRDAEIVISYPRKFGMTNVDEIQSQTEKLFATKPGAEVVEQQFATLFAALYPRIGSERVAELAKSATAHHMAMDGDAGNLDRMRKILAAEDEDEA